jgi:nucleoside-diphosphate-sugar epimerase
MKNQTALVVGANGIIGRNLGKHLQATKNWDVILTSYSELDYESTLKFVKLDLTDPESVAKQASTLARVTHVFFAAYVERKTLAEQTSANLSLMKNLIDGVEAVSPSLKHVTFIQGGKAYGAHLGQYKTPAKETEPRHFPPNFYYSQEDYLRSKSAGKFWTWTAIRPDIVVGQAVGNPMNVANILGVYASLCKELGVAFRFPGSHEAYNALINVTGADILAQGMEWAALNDKCSEEIFNITNGDIFRWSDAWPKIAEQFGLEVADPLTFSLTEYMADKEQLWVSMVEKHGLKDHALSELVQWPFGDFIFNVKYDAFFDVNKARRFGFQAMNLDSAEQIVGVLKNLQQDKILPQW